MECVRRKNGSELSTMLHSYHIAEYGITYTSLEMDLQYTYQLFIPSQLGAEYIGIHQLRRNLTIPFYFISRLKA